LHDHSPYYLTLVTHLVQPPRREWPLNPLQFRHAIPEDHFPLGLTLNPRRSDFLPDHIHNAGRLGLGYLIQKQPLEYVRHGMEALHSITTIMMTQTHATNTISFAFFSSFI
jgi:hypothetical protein